MLSGTASAGDDTLAICLLVDVAQVFTEETIGSAELVQRLVLLEDRPWADWTAGRPLTPARVARLLTPFGIHPVKLRFGARTANGYTQRMFADPWSRYLPKNVEQRNTATNDGDGLSTLRVELDGAGSGADTAVVPDTDGARSGVPRVPAETGPNAMGDDGVGINDPGI